jgi:hypothetical protein
MVSRRRDGDQRHTNNANAESSPSLSRHLADIMRRQGAAK